MLVSMTGYGRAERQNNKFTFNVEIKSLNNRFIDVVLKTNLQNLNYEEEIISIERQAFFKKNSMQRRHMMHNTHFIKQTENYARVIQYMTLLNTSEGKKTNIV